MPEIVQRFRHPIGETDGLVIHICRRPNDIARAWPSLKKYYGDALGEPAREFSPKTTHPPSM